MPLDAFHLYCITSELNQKLSGGRIDKINMPAANDILLSIRANGENVRLLISADPAKPRLWLSPLDYVNPAVAPAYCMHLRKYLMGGRILSVSSTPTERVVTLEILAHSELGDEQTFRLIIEIMGRYSNVLLVNSRGIITDCLKHTPFGTDTERPLLPNLPYRPVPVSDKFDYTDKARLSDLLSRYKGGDLSAHLLTELAGFASFSLKTILDKTVLSVPPTCAETDATIDKIETAYRRLTAFDYIPKVIEKDGRAVEFTVLDTQGRVTDTLLDAEKAFYGDLDAAALWKSATAIPCQTLNAAVKKLTKRISTLDAKIAETKDADTARIRGEILTANLYRVPPRATALTADNWEDDTQIEIPLDAKLTAVQNANAYFKRYNKLKKAAVVAAQLRSEAVTKRDYLESIQASLLTCTTYDDVEGVKEELYQNNILRRPVVKGKRPPVKNKPLCVLFSDYEIFVGKNNLQNEELTFKTAHGEDLWAHVLRAHGSHVIVKSKNGAQIPDAVVLRACELAAYYSTARLSDKVEVDATLKKYVSRNGAKGKGNVIYTHQKTLVVKPQA